MTSEHSNSSGRDRVPARHGMAQLPGGHGGVQPGSFYSHPPLTGDGPSLAAFLAGWGQRFRALWPCWQDLAGDVTGCLCWIALLGFLLFGALLK